MLEQSAKPLSIRWLYLAVSTLSMLFAGVIYSWSILKVPLAKDFGWNPSQLAMNYTVTMSFFCIGGLFSGLTLKRITPKNVLLIAAASTAAGFIWASNLKGSIIYLYLSYGVLCGGGIGMAYNVLLAATNAWFPDKKGTSSGIQMMAFGASSLIIGSMASWMISAEAIGWRMTYMVLGISTGIMLIIAAMVLRLPPTGVKLPIPKPNRRRSKDEIETKDYTTGEMVRRFTFWRFFLFAITLAAVGNTVISMARDLALSVGAKAGLATTLVGVLSICNGLGRLFSGILFDLIGRRKTMLVGSLLTISAPAFLLTAVLQNSVTLCVVGLCLTGLSYGFSPTMSSTFTMTFYGPRNFAMNFSMINTMLIPTSFVPTLAGTMITKTGSYMAPMIMLIVSSIISLVMNLSIRKP